MGEEDIDEHHRERFTPSWPPRGKQKALPNIFTRCSDKFKKVTWPPQGYEEEKDFEPPPTHIELKDDMPLNDEAWRPVGTYKAAPTIAAEDPDDINTAWPPPEPIDTSEKVLHDPNRHKRAIRDYTVFFKANEAPPTTPSYKVPPGTLHVFSQRGVLSYNTADLGSGRPKDPNEHI